jgi:hypothetical protein
VLVSSVTDVFVIVGDTAEDAAESIAPKVAKAVSAFRGWPDAPQPVISLMRDDWQSLQGGSKVAGSAAIWVGLNFADIEGLEGHLRSEGFKNITLWSHHENDTDHGVAPRVVSW